MPNKHDSAGSVLISTKPKARPCPSGELSEPPEPRHQASPGGVLAWGRAQFSVVGRQFSAISLANRRRRRRASDNWSLTT